MMRKRLFFLVLLFSSLGYGQSKLDSLESILTKPVDDSVKVMVLHQLSDEYSYDSPSKAIELLFQSIELSEKASIPVLTVEGLNKLGYFLSIRASYDSAMEVLEKALLIAEKAEFNVGYSEALIGIGDVFWRRGELKKAQEYQEKNIAFSQSIDNLDGIASSYNTLGNINNDIGEYTKAMEYYTLAAEIFGEIGDERKTSIALTNVGVIHQRLENHEKAISYYLASDSIFRKLKFYRGNAFISSRLATVYKNLKQYEKSLSYSEKALSEFEKLGGRSDIAEIKHNMGNLYWEQEKHKEALPYYLEARTINLEIGDSMAVALNSQSIGVAYFQLADRNKALQYLEEALYIAKTKGANLTAMDSYETLSAVYFEQQNFKSAYENLSQFIKLRDSLYTIEKRDLANEIEAKYQNEAKQKEIELLESENTLQELQISKRQNERNGLIILSIVALFGVGLLINQYRIKQAANRQLRELDRIKSIFFENLSHEFRTPLSLILAPVKDRINKATSKEDEHLFHTIIRNAENLDGLIKELLDLAKLEKGMFSIQHKEVDASKLFKIIAASYESLASVKKIEFVAKVPEGEQWLLLDEELLKKICHNLLSNAFKFSPEESMITFKIAYADTLKISVTDSGPGIPTEDQQLIFDRFYQVEGPQASGTGIGLALTKELVEVVGGRISLESKPGEGSSFLVSIPMNSAEPQEVIQQKVHHDLNAQYDEGTLPSAEKEQTLLIIEDNDDLRSYLSQTFSTDFNVHLSVDGQTGIDTAKEVIPDLIISDIMMAKTDGLEVCKSLRSNVETDHIPIILLTARADQETKLMGLEYGADAYLLKPFDPEELRATVSNLIQQRERLRARYTSTIGDEEETRIQETHPFIKKCEAIIQNYLSDDSFSADDFAREVGMSRMQVHRKLKALTDLSTTAFIRHHRLRIAKSLLEKGEPVSQVAYAVGFSSLSYFTKSFKEQFEHTPSQFNKKAD